MGPVRLLRSRGAMQIRGGEAEKVFHKTRHEIVGRDQRLRSLR